jgi:TrmH family RNA methyltransferase
MPRRLEEYRDSGFAVISSQLDGDSFFSREPITQPLILILGNEGNGVSSEVKKIATHRFRLPMRGEAESLNVAVAAGIMMYDLTRSLPE